MAFVARQAVSVTTAATRLDADPTDPAAGVNALVVAQASGTLVLGPSTVTAANGCRIPVVAGTVITSPLQPGETLYGIVASGSLSVDVLLESA